MRLANVFVATTLFTVSLWSPSNASEPSNAQETARISIVSRAAIAIEAPTDIVWRFILDQYQLGEKFVEDGFDVLPLKDDPAALLGGYRVQKKDESGALIYESIGYVSELDHAERRLSIYARFPIPESPADMTVNVTYEAIADGAHTTLEAHVYGQFTLAVGPSGNPTQDLRAQADAAKLASDDNLAKTLKRAKSRLETND